MKRVVIILALVASALAPAGARAEGASDSAAALAEDEAIDKAIAEAEREAIAPAPPLAVRRDKPLVTAPPAEGLGLAPKLALCALLAGAIFWVARKRLGGRLGPGAPTQRGDKPRVLSRTAIGLRHEVVVLEVEGQRFLLGVAPSSIASLGLLPDEPVLSSAEHEHERERERERVAGLINDEPPLPMADGLARLIAASRVATGRADGRPVASSGPLATGIHERARGLSREDVAELTPTRPTRLPQPARKRTSRPEAIGGDSAAEGQVRGLSRRAAP